MTFLAGSIRAQSPAASDAYWTLLHEEAVLDDLNLTAAQRPAFRSAVDVFDLQLFPLRNRPGKEASEGLARIVADAKTKLAEILKPEQRARLEKLVVRQLGTRALLQDDVRQHLALTEKQQATIDEATGQCQAALAKLREQAKGRSQDELNKEAAAIQSKERDAIVAALTDVQKRKWSGLMAADFDASRLGRTRFKVPELIGDKDAWRNSPPLTLAGERGKVVVVHFFACGCINCIHNYPTYRQWREELAGKDVTLIGIHTPETNTERDIAHLERKLKEDDLQFPVLIDNGSANWNAWGNSMWPSVYVIDKQGYLRHFWAGELKWEGATGDQIARDQIERLLKE
jgi:peroxiredoxin